MVLGHRTSQGRKVSFLISFLFVIVSTSVLFVHAIALPGSWKTETHLYTPRSKLALACHGNTVFVYGGRSGFSGNAALNSLFQYNTSSQSGQWKELFSTGLVPYRYGSGLFYFPAVDQLYVFGGQDETGAITNQVWIRSSGRWSEASQVNSAFPVPRTRFSSWMGAATNVFYVFSGMTELGPTNEVWSYDRTTNIWTLLNDGTGTAPGKRYDPCCTYEAVSQKVYCFGGTSSNGDLNDFWRFDMITNTWMQLTVTGPLPPTRRLAVCEITGGYFFLWGGFDSAAANYVADTKVHRIALATLAWNSILQDTSLITRDSHKLCANNDGLYMFGGATSEGRKNEVWKLNTGTFKFELVLRNSLRPPGRAGHSVAVVASNMFIAFGRDANGVVNDVWSYDLINKAWTERIPVTVLIPAPRQRTACANVGPVIYFFGGELADGVLSNALFAFQTSTNTWSEISQQNVPMPRTLHSLGVAGNQLLLFGGSNSTGDSVNSNELYLFEFVSQSWKSLQVSSNSTIPEPRRGQRFFSDVTTGDIYLFGGMYQIEVTLMDRYRFYNVHQMVNGNWIADVEKLPSTVPVGSTERAFIRTLHAVAGSGNRYLLCGGSITTGFPASTSEQCYMYDAISGENTGVGSNLEVPNFEATAAYFQNSYYLFGGQLAGDSIERPFYLNHLQVFTFDASAMCGQGQSGVSCMPCSAGTINPSCVVVAAGRYSALPAAASSTPCPPGTYSSQVGAQTADFCTSCPVGSYSNFSGAQSCTKCVGECQKIGSATSADDSVRTTDEAKENTEFQPAGHSGGYIPRVAWMVIGGITFIIILVLVLLLLNASIREKGNMNWYFTEENRALVQEIFEANEMKGYGLDQCSLFTCCTDPRLKCQVHPDYVVMVFKSLDDDGSGYADEGELFKILQYFIDDDKMPPMPGSKRESEGAKAMGVPCLQNFRFAKIDLWRAQHELAMPGDPLCVQKTKFGGVTSCIFIFLVAVLISALLLQFFFTNMFETRGSLPLSVLSRQVRSDISISAAIFGGATEEGCVSNQTSALHSSWFKCALQTYVNYDSRFSPLSTHTACSFDNDTESCHVQWQCRNCSIPQGVSLGAEFIFHPSFSGQFFGAEIRSTTGVINENTGTMDHSVLRASIYPETNDTVFRGRPGSILSFTAAPIFFSTVTFLTQTPEQHNGFQMKLLNVTQGHTVSGSDFNLFFGAPLTFMFSSLDVALIVDRKPHKDLLTVLTAILGAVSGLAAATVFVVQVWDAHCAESRYEEYRDSVDDLPDDNHKFNMTSLSQDRRLLENLTKKRVNFGVAFEHLQLIRRCFREMMADPTLAMSGSFSPEKDDDVTPITKMILPAPQVDRTDTNPLMPKRNVTSRSGEEITVDVDQLEEIQDSPNSL